MPTKQEINQTAKDIDILMDTMYKDTYKTNQTNRQDLLGIKAKSFDSLKKIMQNNIDTTGNSAFSQILNRMSSSENDTISKKSKSGIQELFELFKEGKNDDIANNILSNGERRNIIEYDAEIDTMCEYLPILKETIDVKRDSVLSADQFSKDFLMISDRNAPDDKKDDDIEAMKKNYNLIEKVENIYDEVSLYGEVYMYTAPYSEEIKKQLELKSNNKVVTESATVGIREQYENANLNQTIIHESLNLSDDNDSNYFFKINVNYSGVLESVINETEGVVMSNKINSKFKFTPINEDVSKNSATPTDGLINSSNKDQLSSIPGAIVKQLNRSDIIPMYINKNTCFGYFYFEGIPKELNATSPAMSNMALSKMGNLNKSMSANNSINTNMFNSGGVNDNVLKDDMMKKAAQKIAERITPKFIVNNQDLKYEIYTILKYSSENSNIGGVNITFIPPEYVDHFYWEKDENNRGVSDLARSMVPAKLYIALYTGNTIGILTRGFDKRVYYVKNTVDTNISQNLMTTLNAIKAGNKGMRDFSAMKNIINSSGRFTDLLVPMSKTGEAPIEFSVMEGQNIDTKESLLEQLEHMAVAPTGVPYEFLMSRKTVDYAVRLTMANGKFLKDVYKRQSRFERPLSRWISKIYNYEYMNTDTLDVKLPPPAYLSILNASQMIDNVKTMLDSVLDLCNTDEQLDETTLKEIKKNLSKKYLGGYISFDEIEAAFDEARVKTSPSQPGDQE